MDGNGQLRKSAADANVLCWPGRVLAAEDLRRSLNGQREVVLLPGTVVTPLAWEQLRTIGVSIKRQPAEGPVAPPSRWGFAQERPHPTVRSAVQALEREGLAFKELGAPAEAETCRWARAVAECVARGECPGGVLFCQDPGLACCVSNKFTGLRAVPVVTVAQAARATLTLGANLLAVEMPGRTFFEVRQILRILCTAGEPVCPAGVACTLKELDGHAHR
jgi:ribose 5-phosphate isomerase RpiB